MSGNSHQRRVKRRAKAREAARLNAGAMAICLSIGATIEETRAVSRVSQHGSDTLTQLEHATANWLRFLSAQGMDR